MKVVLAVLVGVLFSSASFATGLKKTVLHCAGATADSVGVELQVHAVTMSAPGGKPSSAYMASAVMESIAIQEGTWVSRTNGPGKNVITYSSKEAKLRLKVKPVEWDERGEVSAIRVEGSFKDQSSNSVAKIKYSDAKLVCESPL